MQARDIQKKIVKSLVYVTPSYASWVNGKQNPTSHTGRKRHCTSHRSIDSKNKHSMIPPMTKEMCPKTTNTQSRKAESISSANRLKHMRQKQTLCLYKELILGTLGKRKW